MKKEKVPSCSCGSKDFLVETMVLKLGMVPLRFGNFKGAVYQYDDSKAQDCDGWDWLDDDVVICKKCGLRWSFDGEELTDEAKVC